MKEEHPGKSPRHCSSKSVNYRTDLLSTTLCNAFCFPIHVIFFSMECLCRGVAGCFGELASWQDPFAMQNKHYQAFMSCFFPASMTSQACSHAHLKSLAVCGEHESSCACVAHRFHTHGASSVARAHASTSRVNESMTPSLSFSLRSSIHGGRLAFLPKHLTISSPQTPFEKLI